MLLECLFASIRVQRTMGLSQDYFVRLNPSLSVNLALAVIEQFASSASESKPTTISNRVANFTKLL